VPTGHIFIIFELDGIPRKTFDNTTLEPRETFKEGWISGMHTNCLSISAHEDSEMFVIQFKPEGAYPFLHIPIHELNEQILPFEKVLGSGALTLREQILTADEPQDKFKIAEDWLNRRFDREKKPPGELLKVLARLQSEPVANLANIIQKYPYTHKHLIDQFKKYIGLTPKVYQRILRFNEILQRIQEKEIIKWAEIAYQCGYSDQSHFIKEFNRHSGFNPQEFIDQGYNSQAPNFFPLDG